MSKIFYDNHADIAHLKNKTIGIIGYGIQGRAQALNFRDSGLNVHIANRRDNYRHQAEKDGFNVFEVEQVVSESDLLLLLIPDQAQKGMFDTTIRPNLKPGTMIIFAHGYALRFENLEYPNDIDVGMLAPRMPGRQIRDYYKNGRGVPAFIDIVKNNSDQAWPRLLALAKAAGFTRAGVLEVSYRVEAELDLFVEQFLIPNIIQSIHVGFNTLVNKFDFPPVPTLIELYASGELAEVLKLAAQMGIGKAFQENASPTCQFGIASSIERNSKSKAETMAKEVMTRIQDGSFRNDLEREGKADYPAVKQLWKTINNKALIETQNWINQAFKNGQEQG